MKQRIQIGLIGFGTVGTGTYRILRDNADLIRDRVGIPIEVKKIAVRDLHRDRGITVPASLLTGNPSEIIDDPEIDIVVELIGGYQPAKDLILAAIARGKHVVTANKALLAAHGTEIQAAARQAGVTVGFEASVAGGIPVIKALKESLAANRILSIYGIINGTSNYILSKMTDEERSFADVLAEAQRAGYAEADPTFDVGGIDTAHKLAILVNLAFGANIRLADIYTEGITKISPLDIDFGKTLGYKVKLLAIAKMREGKVEARVHPTMVPDEYPIAKVGGVYNAIQIVGDACQDIMLYGRGAGSLPTGSAVVADLMDIARWELWGPRGQTPLTRTTGAEGSDPSDPSDPSVPGILPMDAVTSLYYFRLMALDQPGVLSQISGILGRHQISIAQMIQRGRKQGGSVPLVIMTHTALERDIQKALVEIKALACVTEEPVLIRVEGEEP
ncbi:MAG TPA: homoserine dehydrogenase [Terriglobia bacterium]|nr:homoserine dehydrogenase [Terriglobia bacterium]